VPQTGAAVLRQNRFPYSGTSLRKPPLPWRAPVASGNIARCSASWRMPTASPPSASSQPRLLMKSAAHYGGTHIRRCCTAVFRQSPPDSDGGEGGAHLHCERNPSNQRRRRPDRVSHQKSATPEGGRRPQCGDPGGDRPDPQRSGQDRRHGGHATGGTSCHASNAIGFTCNK